MAEATDQKIDEREEKEKSVVGGGRRRLMCELTPDIQNLISSFLYAGDSIIFRRLISKSLASNLITPSPSRRMMSIEPHPLPQFPELPYLLSLQKDVLKFYHPLMSGFYSMQIPELSEARIGFSNHGWLVMHSDDNNSFLFEPLSRQKIALPNNPEEFCCMFFNSPPTCPNCFVIALGTNSGEYYITRPDEESWTKRSIRRAFSFCLSTLPVMRDGLCYFLGNHGYLGVFKLDEKKPSWTVCGQKYDKELAESVTRSFLLETTNDGEFLRVLVVGEEKRIKLWTINVRKKTWIRKKSLGDKILFLSSKGSFLESSGLRGMCSKIYFPKLYSGASMFYSVSAERHLSYHCDYSSENGYDGGVQNLFGNSVWFKPVFSGTATK